ncbi:LOW QUALITY PROTEIN: lipoyltransferase 1, mitochondrial [Tachyglossus aculeatus]|uniref:LOW QUALITY PROTEIN: lipoyltransferase 1, mitochondrial n=1 Tax=Tachyglossus aculeatus TaxID=9261 RepID=UPI0018F38E1A|nr:LOW QUALITY PROTEIN: lipoyltransferase 1, mitochondrial [Tachyglossus aculeatus]
MPAPSSLKNCARLGGVLTAPGGGGGGGGVILQSVSHDVYENLAVEDWVHDHANLEGRPVLFVWRNSPSVVIGRHQNPWQECDLRLLRARGVRLARRKSGGGAVFHDLGNVNLTFFTTRGEHDRRGNLDLVARALRSLQPRLDVAATARLDLVLDGGFKVSGTASRVGRAAAYHHCTLLCGTDAALLAAALRGPAAGLAGRATRSVPASVKNLREADPALTWERVAGAVAAHFAAARRARPAVLPVDPADEAAFPGLARRAAELRSWDWVFGRSPPFSLRACLDVPAGGAAPLRVGVALDVRAGRIRACRLDVPDGWLPGDACDRLGAGLAGRRFRPGDAAAPPLPLGPRDPEGRRRWRLLCEALETLM